MAAPKTLSGFLLARLAEEETAALDARRWYHRPGLDEPVRGRSAPVDAVTEAFATFVLSHDPDRILTECVAKKRLIKLVTGRTWSGSDGDRESVLRLLALPYADHWGYRDEWREP